MKRNSLDNSRSLPKILKAEVSSRGKTITEELHPSEHE